MSGRKRFVVVETHGFPTDDDKRSHHSRRGEIEISILDRANAYRPVDRWIVRVSRFTDNGRRLQQVRRGAEFLCEQLEIEYGNSGN